MTDDLLKQKIEERWIALGAMHTALAMAADDPDGALAALAPIWAEQDAAVRTRAIEGLLDRDCADLALKVIAAEPRAAADVPVELAVRLGTVYYQRNRIEEARDWWRYAILADVEQLEGYVELARSYKLPEHAGTVRALLHSGEAARSSDPRIEARRGKLLWEAYAPQEAILSFRRAFDAGLRDIGFIREYAWLLTGERRYHDVTDLARDPLVMAEPELDGFIEMLAGHARLAMAADPERVRERLVAREESPRWIPATRVLPYLKTVIDQRDPFCWIRIGDGEARFIVNMIEALRRPITNREALQILRNVWHNWFAADPANWTVSEIEKIWVMFSAAMENTDLLGTTPAQRFIEDTANYGYFAWTEDYLEELEARHPQMMLTEALALYTEGRRDPLLSTLLHGLDFLGLISPHEGLADMLRTRLEIGTVASYVIPAERVLADRHPTDRVEPHYPGVFEQLMATLTVPYRGAVFIVAGGLLGKIYCSRIKELGGIALDVGAIVDRWMGLNTRPGHFDVDLPA